MATRTSKRNLIRLEKKQQQQICKRRTLFGSLFLPSLHNYDVNLFNFTLHQERKQTTTNIFFSFWTWILFFGLQLQESSLTFDKVSELKQPSKVSNNAKSLSYDVFTAVPVGFVSTSWHLKLMIIAARRELTRPQSSLSCLYSLIIY